MTDENGMTVPAGGAIYVAAWMKRLEDENTPKVAQGDPDRSVAAHLGRLP